MLDEEVQWKQQSIIERGSDLFGGLKRKVEFLKGKKEKKDGLKWRATKPHINAVDKKEWQ